MFCTCQYWITLTTTFAQWHKLTKSHRNISISSWLMTDLYNLVSSANFSILLHTISSMSFIYIYIKNRTGHKTEPCGTPLLLVTMWKYCLVKLFFVPFLKANLGSNSKLYHLCHELLIYALACNVAIFKSLLKVQVNYYSASELIGTTMDCSATGLFSPWTIRHPDYFAPGLFIVGKIKLSDVNHVLVCVILWT